MQELNLATLEKQNEILSKPSGSRKTFTANGVFTVPEDVNGIFITACGGGGAGGSNIPNDYKPSGGGGGASCIIRTYFQVIPGEDIEITVGKGGLPTDKTGNSGTATIISGLITLLPGGGGLTQSDAILGGIAGGRGGGRGSYGKEDGRPGVGGAGGGGGGTGGGGGSFGGGGGGYGRNDAGSNNVDKAGFGGGVLAISPFNGGVGQDGKKTGEGGNGAYGAGGGAGGGSNKRGGAGGDGVVIIEW